MKYLLIFKPLENKKALKVGIVATIVISLVYLTVSVLVTMYSVGFNSMSLHNLFIFSLFKSFSSLVLSDWIFLFLFPLIGGLLFANYEYWKCKNSKTANTGLFAGLIAATCPACILPVLGLTSLTTVVLRISWVVKISALAILLFSIYFIAYRQNKCDIK